MSQPYLEAQMTAYAKAQRPCEKMSGTDMCEIAKKLSADLVKSTAKHYAALKFASAVQVSDPQLASKGKALHEARCEGCHSNGGSDPADDAGILAGQWKPYLEASLQDFASGKRVQPAVMKSKTSGLSADEVHALSAFYASEGTRK
jgi:sulfide dehydrogenase cytochrome subunit